MIIARKIATVIFFVLLIIPTATITDQCGQKTSGENPSQNAESETERKSDMKTETSEVITNNVEETAEEKVPDKNREDISGLTSMEITRKMNAGWNLGNTFDAHWNAKPWGTINTPADQETMWGNPVTTKAMIDKIKASGFDTVRIPVTWYIHTGPGPDYKIDGAWMDRIQEVVDYVIDNGMFCILNTHHEDYIKRGNFAWGWLTLYHVEKDNNRPLNDTEKAEIRNHLSKIWEQIAERFKDYDEHLIFEAVNEPRSEGLNNNKDNWAEQCNFLNDLLQSFVDTVRAGGGKNLDRHLMVCPFYASVGMDPNDGEKRIDLFIDKKAGKLRINDPRNRLIASIHYYEPWGFVTAPDDSQWFSWYFDLKVGSVSSNINNIMKILEKYFVTNEIPVIMGETGAIHRIMPDGQTNEAERVKWAEYYIGELSKRGVPSIIWDDGGSFKLFDRKELEWFYPDLCAAFVKAAQISGE